MRAALEGGAWGGPHHVSPSVLSLSQATECGTIYRVAEIKELADDRAQAWRRRAHGRRAARQCARAHERLAAEATWKAGVDVLSFGATKGGAMGAEAVIFFDPKRGANMQDRRKRGGATASKHRFIAAQMEAYLADDLWLQARAPRQRDGGRAGRGIDGGGLQAGLAGRGERGLRADHGGDGQAAESRGRDVLPVAERRRAAERTEVLVRLVTSFQTTSEDVEKFLAIVRS